MNQTARTRQSSDESYIIALCDELLGIRALRHHTFPFLRGDPNKRGIRARLPVDAYYQGIDLVVEYHERQHTERHPWFDRRIVNDKTGETRGAQRKRYDKLRTKILPKHGITLIVLDYGEFGFNSAKRLRRQIDPDRAVLRHRLAEFLPASRRKKTPTTKVLERVTLHREMQSILRDAAKKWMLAAEIAAAVNRRGRYHRRDGKPVSASQVIARATRYGALFERRTGRRGVQLALKRSNR